MASGWTYSPAPGFTLPRLPVALFSSAASPHSTCGASGGISKYPGRVWYSRR